MEYFTWQYLATVAGATAAVLIITNAIAMAFDFRAKWLALAVAFVVQLAVWLVTSRTAEGAGLALINTFVIYLAAGGANQIVYSQRAKSDRLEFAMPDKEGNWRTFWTPWW